MEKMTHVSDLARDTRGSSLIEKLIVLAVVSLAVIGGVQYYQSAIRQKTLDLAVRVRDL